MDTGTKLRFTIHNILYEVSVLNKNLNSPSIKMLISKNSHKNIAFINNVCLNSMRFKFHINKIIKLYSKKKPRINEEILLTSAITQIIYLDFPEYAVINCSVELAKKLKIYHGFINAVLKKIFLDKNKLKQIKKYFN